jgi:glutamine synthetase
MTMIHPGYNLLAEGWADRADEALRIVRRTAEVSAAARLARDRARPEPVEAVFDATDALTAADHMVAFATA